MVYISSCCCCFSLKTGTYVIGIFKLVICCLAAFILLHKMAASQAQPNHFAYELYDTNSTTGDSMYDYKKIMTTRMMEYQSRKQWLKLALFLKEVLLVVLLIFGVKFDRPKCVFLYLWGESVSIALQVIALFIYCFVIESAKFLLFTILCLLVNVLPMYMFLVVYSFYKEMTPSVSIKKLPV